MSENPNPVLSEGHTEQSRDVEVSKIQHSNPVLSDTQRAPAKISTVPFWRRLRWNLTITFVLLAVLPVVLVIFFTLTHLSAQTRQQFTHQLEEIAASKQTQIARWLETGGFIIDLVLADSDKREMLTAVAADTLLPNPSPDEARLNRANLLLADAVKAQNLFTEFFLYNARGRVVAASNPNQIGEILNDRPYFADSLVRDFIQPPYHEVGVEDITMIITRPLPDSNGQTTGVLAGRLNLKPLSQIMTGQTSLGRSGETYLVSPENHYLVTPSRFADQGYRLTHPYHSQGIDRALQGESGSGFYEDYRNPPVPVIGVYHWLPDLQVAFLAEIDQTEALAPFIEIRNFSLIIAALAAFMAVLLGLYNAARISRPVAELTQTATQIAAGDLSQRAKIPRLYEIGLLAVAFNTMTARLNNVIDDLAQHIAELQQAQQDLQANEARLSVIFNNTSDAQALSKVEPGGIFRLVAVNQSYLTTVRQLGINISEQDFVGKRFDTILLDTFGFSEEIVEHSRQYYRQAVETGRPIRYEDVIQMPAGNYYSEITVVPVVIDSTVRYILWTSRDITERKRAEEALQQYQEQLEELVAERTAKLQHRNRQLRQEIEERKRVAEELRLHQEIVENMAEGVHLLNTNSGTFIYTNPKLEQMFGYEPGEMVGRHVSIINAPSDKSPEETAAEIIGSLEKTGKWRGEVYNIKRDKTPFWCAAHVSTFEHSRYGTVWVTVQEDITERKQTEEELEKYRRHLEMLVKQRTLELEMSNEQLQQEIEERKLAEHNLRMAEERYRTVAELTSDFAYSTWVKPDGTLIGEWITEAFERILGYQLEKADYMSLIYPDDVPIIMDRVQTLLSGQPAVTEHRVVTRSGQVRWLRDYGRPVWGEAEQRVVRIYGAAQDITERKQAEEQLKASLKEKEVMLKEIHHRVKNNMQIMSSLLDLQAATIQDEQVLELFKESQGRIKSMALIHERLYGSKDLAHIDFADYVESLTHHLLHSYGAVANNVTLNLDIGPLLLSIETAIPCGLIINELISNAFKHAFPNGRSGKIWVELDPAGDSQLSLVVRDDGVGLPPDFDFYRTSSLGITLVNTLVKQIEGSIELESKAGTAVKIIFINAVKTITSA